MVFRFVCVLLLALALPATAQGPKFRISPSVELHLPDNKRNSKEAQDIANRALAAFARNDLVTARKDFLKVLELAPGNLPTLINLGLLEYRAKKYEDAEQVLKRVVRSEPETGLGWLILGVVYYDQGKLDPALAALAQAVLYEPKDARAHHYLGVTIGRKGWYLGAEDEMRKAIALAPDYPEAHFNLAVFYLQRTPPAIELSRRHYQQALNLGAAPDSDVEKKLAEAGE